MAVLRKPGWWYPYIFVALFVVVLLVNLTMAYFASSTFSGMATENPYEKGLAYNQNLAMARAQAALGWRVDSTIGVAEGAPHRTVVTVTYINHDGRPVDGLDVHAQLVRPTAKGYDRSLVLDAVAPGTYRKVVDLPMAGVWDMDVVALSKDATYEFGRRIVAQ
jgi:nitrogen fixation protein FixH